MPNDFVGFFAHHAGIVKAKDGLMACKQLSIEQGADLRYNTNVKSVDINAGTVELSCGKKLRGKHVVISCGPFTDQFYEPGAFNAKKLPQETYVIDNNRDLPGTMIISGVPEFGGYDIYALKDGENMEHYKFGYEKGSGDSTITLGLLKKFFPTKYNDLIHVAPCCYSVTPGEEFVFEKREKAVYAFGLNGRGFKHLPYHGKRVLHLINGHFAEANKYAKN